MVLVAMGIFASTLAAWEGWLCSQNAPRVEPATEFVATAHRIREIGRSSRPQVVFVGSSRTFVGVSPATVKEALAPLDVDVRSVALPGSASRPLVEIVHEHCRFSGVIVAEVLPESFYVDGVAPAFGSLKARLALAGWYEEAEYHLAKLRSHVLSVGESNAPIIRLRDRLRDTFIGGREFEGLERQPVTAAYMGYDDGWVALKPNPAYLAFAEKDVRHAATMMGRYASPGDRTRWMKGLDRWNKIDQRLQDTDVTLVFVRFPSAGLFYEAEQRRFPDELYWEELKRHFPGRCFHFLESPELQALKMPDGSHLVAEDALKFSRWTADFVGKILDGKEKALP